MPRPSIQLPIAQRATIQSHSAPSTREAKIRSFWPGQRKYKFVLVAAARWEEEHIAEWIAYHASIGYDHVYLYSNDDEPLHFYQAIQPYLVGKAPFVTYYHCVTPGVQRRMFLHFLETHGREAEWVSFFDIDEFLRIPGFASVDAFVRSHPRTTDSIYLNWAYFGNDGFKERPKGSVLLNYVRRQKGLDRHAKTITRRSSINPKFLAEAMAKDLRFQHGWSGPLNDHMRRINVLGDDMADWYVDLEKANAYIADPARVRSMYEVGVLHHYAMKSEQDFMRRVRRGSHGDHVGQLSWQTMWRPENGAASLLASTKLKTAPYRTTGSASLAPRAVACNPDLPPASLQQAPEHQTSIASPAVRRHGDGAPLDSG